MDRSEWTPFGLRSPHRYGYCACWSAILRVQGGGGASRIDSRCKVAPTSTAADVKGWSRPCRGRQSQVCWAHHLCKMLVRDADGPLLGYSEGLENVADVGRLDEDLHGKQVHLPSLCGTLCRCLNGGGRPVSEDLWSAAKLHERRCDSAGNGGGGWEWLHQARPFARGGRNPMCRRRCAAARSSRRDHGGLWRLSIMQDSKDAVGQPLDTGSVRDPAIWRLGGAHPCNRIQFWCVI